MLAAMNGHTSTVKLLLDFGSDISAQVHTICTCTCAICYCTCTCITI